MDIYVQYIDDTKLDHYYTQVARRSDRKPYRCADNQPLQDLLTGLINFSRAPHKVSDACLELQSKTSRRYLDMEYTLKEHTQDFGVTIGAEECLIVRTKLSVLVAALKDLMEKCSYGGDTRTLRNILKHILSIIEDDTDFAPELLRQQGLAFFRNLPDRDNYTKFDRKKVTTNVLNVILKIVSYVDGLMAVLRDRSTVSWLYSQLKACTDANNPEGRNITIAVLYIFVDSELESDGGSGAPGPHDLAVMAVRCAQEVHHRAKSPPFSVFLELLKEGSGSDSETVLALVQLINKMLETLKEADEMDLFDDLVSALLEQGLSKIIERHKQGKTAKNKIVQEYNKFTKLLCQEYEDGKGQQGGTGDLDLILKSCIHRRPSYQPGSIHSGSEDNLSLIDRNKPKRNSLTHNTLSPHSSTKSEFSTPRSMTPDLVLSSPAKSLKSPLEPVATGTGSPEPSGGKTGFGARNSKESKRTDFSKGLSNGTGRTSTPKQESLRPSETLFDKKAFKQYGGVSGDSYTKGSYRPLNSPGGDSGYFDSSDKIISPHDWNRKMYTDRMGGDSTISLTESVTDRNARKNTNSETPVHSAVSAGRNAKQTNSPYSAKPVSTEPSTNKHAPLTAVKSHPYRDSVASPAGPPRKLDSQTSSYAPVSANPTPSRVSQLDKQREIFRQSKPPDSPTKKLETEKKEPVSNSQPDSRWKRSENSYRIDIGTKDKEKSSSTESQSPTQDTKPTNQESKPRETRSFQERNSRKMRLDAGQIMTAVTSSQGKEDPLPNKEADLEPAADPYARYNIYKQTQTKRQPLKQESQPERKEHGPVDPQVSLQKRRIALALSSEKSVSIDEKKIEARGVTIPVLKPSPFEKQFDPPGSPSRLPLARQEPEPEPEPEPPADKPPLPPYSQAEKLGFVDFGCDLASSESESDVYIVPFSPELKWSPALPLPPSQAPVQQVSVEKRKPEVSSEKKVTPLPTQAQHDPTRGISPPSSPTEDTPLARELASRRKSCDLAQKPPALLPLPEVDLAKHELNFGPIEFNALSSRYDKDPYAGEGTPKHVPGNIPAPPPDLPSANRIPPPPPNIPEAQPGGGQKRKSGTKFRWNLVGKGDSEKRRCFWKFDKIFEVPQDIINSFTIARKEVAVVQKAANPVEKKIEVLEMKRRTSLGVNLKSLQRFEMREDDNFRNLRKYLGTLDLEVINEEIIDVLEKGVLVSSFDSELADIRRAKQDALSLGQSVTLREEEKFLLALGEVDKLKERINIATFCLRFHEKEEEIAKKLLTLMLAASEIKSSPTFHEVLKTLLHIGNAIEDREAGGFDLEFLERAEYYKDSCQKNLINHAASCVMDRYPSSTNLYSDFPNVHDAWRMELEFGELRTQIMKEQANWSRCKLNLEDLKLVNHDKFTARLQEFGCKINKFYITLGRMENYYRDLYLYFGYDKYLADSQKLLNFLRVLHNFSLAYKTHHERIIQIRGKMALEKRREKTRGKKLPIAENIQVKIVDRGDQEGGKTESGTEDDGSGYSRGVMNAVMEHGSKEKRRPKTGLKYRQGKQSGNKREKRSSIRRTLNEEDGLIEQAKKEFQETPAS